MKRGWLGLVVVLAAAFGATPARSGTLDNPSDAPCATPASAAADTAAGRTIGGHGFYYCGYHWGTYPARFSVAAAVSQPGVTRDDVVTSATAAAAAWNQAWPAAAPGSCHLCYSTSASNTIVFGALPDGVVARTSFGPPGSTVYTGFTMVLNSNLKWMVAPVAQGAAGYPYQSACAVVWTSTTGTVAQCDAYDLQDVITHELGHVIGLEHVGNTADCNADLTTIDDVQETMFACISKGETSKRTLGWGDILGLQRVALSP